MCVCVVEEKASEKATQIKLLEFTATSLLCLCFKAMEVVMVIIWSTVKQFSVVALVCEVLFKHTRKQTNKQAMSPITRADNDHCSVETEKENVSVMQLSHNHSHIYINDGVLEKPWSVSVHFSTGFQLHNRFHTGIIDNWCFLSPQTASSPWTGHTWVRVCAVWLLRHWFAAPLFSQRVGLLQSSCRAAGMVWKGSALENHGITRVS